MSLTGGLDTRMIMACRKPDPGSLPCYTFGSMFRENQDVRVARRVARSLQPALSSHHCRPRNFCRNFPTTPSARCTSPMDAWT